MRPRRFHLIAHGASSWPLGGQTPPKVITEAESPRSTVAGRGSAQSGPGARWTNHLQTPQAKTSIHDFAVSLPGDGRSHPPEMTPGDREVCVRQSAGTVLGVLRERGRRGLPLEELYRKLFNPQLYLPTVGSTPARAR